MAKKKLRVGILFGGRSGEHEVSLLSAASILKAIDRKKFDVVPIGITKAGRWLTAGGAEVGDVAASMNARSARRETSDESTSQGYYVFALPEAHATKH